MNWQTRVLVDLDGVVVDLMGEAVHRGLFDHPPCRWDFQWCCTTLSMDDVFSGDIFATAPPIRAALHGVTQLVRLGYDVHFVSTPWPTNHRSAADKYEWVERYGFPAEMLTLTHDKALIPADILIDDRPELSGPWRHVTYPQPWNDSDYPSWSDGLASVVLGMVGAA